MQLRMHSKAGNKRQLTWSTGDTLFFQSSVVCVRLAFSCVACLFLLSSPCFLLFSFLFSLFSFSFLESWRWDERRWQVLKLLRSTNGCCFWGQRKWWPRHAGFGLCSFSLLLLMPSLKMTKMMAMKACCSGGVVALTSVFSLLSTVSFLWLSLPCLSLVSLVFLFSFFLCSLLSFSASVLGH